MFQIAFWLTTVYTLATTNKNSNCIISEKMFILNYKQILEFYLFEQLVVLKFVTNSNDFYAIIFFI